MRNRITTIPAALLLAALAACGSGPPAEKGSTDTGISVAGQPAAETAAPGSPAAGDAAGNVAGEAARPAVAATAAVIQSRSVDASPYVAELIRAEREDGVLTLEVRVRNTGSGSTPHSFDTGHGDYSKFYVTAGAQKYFILKDAEGAPLAPKYLDVSIGPGEAVTWWGKFPAPPASETEIDFVMPDVTPFEDVPITEG